MGPLELLGELLQRGHTGADCRCGQVSRRWRASLGAARVAASVTSGIPVSAFETGQFFTAPSACSTNPSRSMPGTVPDHLDRALDDALARLERDRDGRLEPLGRRSGSCERRGREPSRSTPPRRPRSAPPGSSDRPAPRRATPRSRPAGRTPRCRRPRSGPTPPSASRSTSPSRCGRSPSQSPSSQCRVDVDADPGRTEQRRERAAPRGRRPRPSRRRRRRGRRRAPVTSSAEWTIRCPWPSTSSIVMRQWTSSRPGGVPAAVSSPASDIVKQPPCAAASSSSGLVFPSGAAIRVGSEYGSAVNAPEDAAVIAPAPRARFPSHTTSASRTIRGMRAAVSPRATVGHHLDPAGRLLFGRIACLAPRTFSIARMETSTWSSVGSRVVSRWSHSPGASSVISTRLSWCLPA